MRGNGGENVLALDSQFFGLYDELFNVRTQQLRALGLSRFGKRCYNGADTRLGHQQSVGRERCDDLMCCVWIDL